MYFPSSMNIVYADTGLPERNNGLGQQFAQYHVIGWEASLKEMGAATVKIVAVDNSSSNYNDHLVMALIDDEPALLYREPAVEFMGNATAKIDTSDKAWYVMHQIGWRETGDGWEEKPAAEAEQATLF